MLIRHRNYVFLLCFCCLLFLQKATGQSNAYAQFDSNLVETGNPFVMHLSVPKTVGKPLKIDFSAWDSLIPPKNILSQSGWADSGGQFVNDLTLIAFDADTLALPPLTVQLSGDRSAITNPMELIVLATPFPSDPNDLADIKGIHPEAFQWTDALPWVYIIGGILLLALLAYWLLSRYKKTKSVVSRTVELPPHVLAMKKLEALSAKKLWQNGQLKDYYAELTYIVREYLEKSNTMPALESTSDEIMAHLDRADFPEPLRLKLREMLQHADLAKFAKAAPPSFFHEQAMADARVLVGKPSMPHDAAHSR